MAKTPQSLDDLFNEHEAEQEAKPAPAPTPSVHGLTPRIDYAYASYRAERDAIVASVPRLPGRIEAWRRLDHAAIDEACAGLDAAYRAFIAGPEAQAELAALRAWEDAQPDEVEPVEDDDDSDEDEEA